MSDRADISDLFDEAPCGLLSVCTKDVIVRINNTLAHWLSFDPNRLLGQSFHKILNPGGIIALETHIKPLLHLQGYIEEISLDLMTSKGEHLPFMVNASERRSSDGVLISTRYALIKAKERRTFEKSLMSARQMAESIAQQKEKEAILRDQFIAVLGHDLRNPLSSIISGTNIMKRRANLNENEKLILDGIASSAWRAENLIADILDFARGQLGEGLDIELKVSYELPAVLTQVVEEVRLIEPNRDIELSFNCEHPIQCDQNRLAQLLSNLLSNAVRYGDPSRNIKVLAQTCSKNFTLSVENFGKTIPLHIQQILFEPFSRGATQGQREGLGLGLFIVSQIAKSHGGDIQVVSQKNMTKFTFTMPLGNSLN